MRRVEGIPRSVVTLSFIEVKLSRVKACKCLEEVLDKIDSRTLSSLMWEILVLTQGWIYVCTSPIVWM